MSHSPNQPQTPEPAGGQQPPRHEAKTGNTLWPESTGAPTATDDIGILLLFHGLMGFALNTKDAGRGARQRVCEVGIHTKAPDHEFKVMVIESVSPHGAANCHVLYEFNAERPHDVPGREITIDVRDPVTPGVTFYKPHGDTPETPRDWKYVPDLEGPKLYDRKLVKKPKSMRLRVIVKHGLFFTALPTNREFDRVDEDQVDGNGMPRPQPAGPVGQVAILAAAELGHRAGGHVSIKIGQQEVTLRATGDRKYYICVWNDCPEGDCNFKPESPIKERRNDFHMYRKMFDLGAGKEYGLMLKPNGGVGATPAAGASEPYYLQALYKFKLLPVNPIVSTHDAPCGPGGFGRTDDGFGGGGGG